MDGPTSLEGGQQGRLLTKQILGRAPPAKVGRSRRVEVVKAKWQVCVSDCTEGEGQQEVTDPYGVLTWWGVGRGSLGLGRKDKKTGLKQAELRLPLGHCNGLCQESRGISSCEAQERHLAEAIHLGAGNTAIRGMRTQRKGRQQLGGGMTRRLRTRGKVNFSY